MEERTLEDVVRCLNSAGPPPRDPESVPSRTGQKLWGASGAVVQIIYYVDAEIRSQEEARAAELAKPQV